jgi:CHASE3 domain sensor protein
LVGTAALGALAADDQRLHALRQACALLAHLEHERHQLELRLTAGNRKDPMKVVTGRTSLDEAVDATRDLIRQLDEALCQAAEEARKASRSSP